LIVVALQANGVGSQMAPLEANKVLLNESLNQFISAWRLLARPFPTAQFGEKSGLRVSWAGIPFLFYNAVFLTEPLADATTLKQRIGEATAFMRKQAHAGWMVVCADQLS
jgi:hypothetical protein